MANTPAENRDMVQDCFDREEHLNDWEAKFLESVEEQLDNGLSEKQEAKLETIWKKCTHWG